MDIPDDPIISCIERTGYPPWYRSRPYDDYEEPDCDEDDEDEVYT